MRAAWVARLVRLAEPVLTAAAAGNLHRDLPLRVAAGATQADRAQFTHLEALARTLAGCAPWLQGVGGDAAERSARDRLRDLAHAAIAVAVDPAHPDACNFRSGQQPVVDTAFLAHALLRAPCLHQGLAARDRANLGDALAATRAIMPYQNNWLLFSAMVEAGLHALGRGFDPMRVDHALRSHERWYVGDGVYGDGPAYHADYYNSFVIVPMLADVLDTLPEPEGASGAWSRMRRQVGERFTRQAATQERMIAADGSFPPIGRSIAYRCGAFQLLAQAALQRRLPRDLEPAPVRCALHAVIGRTLDAPGTWDAAGWLMPGLAGHQPGLMEVYISTGSLYLCSTAFLPLGLPADDPFWSAPDAPWTQVRLWSGVDGAADHALHG